MENHPLLVLVPRNHPLPSQVVTINSVMSSLSKTLNVGVQETSTARQHVFLLSGGPGATAAGGTWHCCLTISYCFLLALQVFPKVCQETLACVEAHSAALSKQLSVHLAEHC
jgi:hypothetical protein